MKNRTLHDFARLDSTNIHALKLAADGAEPGTVVWALEQVAGRGQYGRTFSSPAGGLYFSLLLRPDLPPERLPLVTLAVGLGCCLCLEQGCGIAPLLKWPNDLYVHGKKLGGILTETLSPVQGRKTTVVVGIGLNVNSMPSVFSPELAPLITSIKECTGAGRDLRELLERMVGVIEEQAQLLEENQDKLLAQWAQRDYLRGRFIKWYIGDSIITGRGCGLLEDGRYSLCDERGVLHSILAGTVKPG